MQEVTEKNLLGYCLNSTAYNKTMRKSLSDFDKQVNTKIEELQQRLTELNEIKQSKGELVYLIKSTDSEYNYIDEQGNTYEYAKMCNKPILVDTAFFVYEILSYVDVKDISIDRSNTCSSVTKTYVDKVCKVRCIRS